MKRRNYQERVRNLYLPSWLKLRMNDDLKTQADWMIEQATNANADSMSIAVHIKHRPWDVILTVKRRRNDMASQNIKITLTNGQKYKLRQPGTLREINSKRTAIFVFDNLECYEGCSDGVVDEDGDFDIFKPNIYHGMALPFKRLVGWQYIRK